MSFTDRAPDESLGILLPESRAATIWAVAVNGVMAGCRPQYMPVLVALIEAMADPTYGVEHSGNTPGSDTLITLNGPIIKDLKFNYTQGVLREGFMANTSVGRFWRLALRNMAGFLPHKTTRQRSAIRFVWFSPRTRMRLPGSAGPPTVSTWGSRQGTTQ